MRTLREAKAGAGQYMFPHAPDLKSTQEPAYLEKQKAGPVGILTVFDGVPGMGRALGLWFLFAVLVSFLAGYVGRLCLPAGSDFASVFRVTGTVATAIYALYSVPGTIWKGVPWRATLLVLVDGIVYGLATGAILAAFWPSA